MTQTSRRNWRGASPEKLETRQLLAADPMISEFMAKNDNGLLDGDGQNSDWIELYNAGDEAIDLAVWHLTDEHRRLNKWSFPADQPDKTVLGPNQYMVVFASGQHLNENNEPIHVYVDGAGNLHARFKIDADGEYLALSGPGGVVSEFGANGTEFPAQYADISYGRDQISGAGNLFFLEPTPGEANGQGVAGIVDDEVSFSVSGGTFSGQVDVQLSTASENGTIRFTLDGTVPTELSPAYETWVAFTPNKAIALETTTQIRARVFEPNLGPGPVHSESYIQLSDDVADFTSPLPILVLENFGAGRVPNKRAHNPPAGDGGGIRQVERQMVQLDIFDRVDGTSSLQGDPDLATRAGVRVRGSSSANFQKQSLTVEAWGEINDDADIQPFGMPAESDWVLYAPSREFDHTLLHNTFAYELSREIGFYAVRFQFVEVFLNTGGGPLSMDDHDGVYVLMEKIKRDENRVDIEPLSDDGTEGGWLLQSNRMQPVPVGGSEHPPNFHTKGPNREKQGPYGRTFTPNGDQGGDDIPTGYNTFLNFESPRGEEINQQQIDSIVAWFDEFEDALYGPDFMDPEKGYRAYIDVGSFIDHMHLNNLALSFDALQLSTYLLKRSEDHKMELGPIWDLDRAYGSDGRAASPVQNLTYGRQFLWMPRLFEDPDYVQQFQDRWQELREGPFATENLHAIIDRQAAEITEEVAARNRTSSWPAKLQSMKDWLATRVLAIDELYLSKPHFIATGPMTPGATVDLVSSAEKVYYTTDGTDPRLSADEISPNAIEGTGGTASAAKLVAADAPASAIVPDESFHQTFGMSWNGQDPDFDDSAAAGWKQGTMGIGYDENDTYLPLLGLDLLSEMLDVNASLYARIEFSIDGQLPDFDFLRLKMRYDDGFIAYLNGVAIARANAPSNATWDSRSTGSHRDSLAVEFEEFNVTAAANLLRPGKNVLAIHGMNSRNTGNDMLIQAELEAATFSRIEVTVPDSGSIIARAFEDGRWSGPAVLEVTALAGDANGDGIFNSSDLTLVFQAGEYEDDIAGNSTFAEGDWNGDGDFTSADLVLAFASGSYSSAAQNSAAPKAMSLRFGQLSAEDLLFADEDFEFDTKESSKVQQLKSLHSDPVPHRTRVILAR